MNDETYQRFILSMYCLTAGFFIGLIFMVLRLDFLLGLSTIINILMGAGLAVWTFKKREEIK